MFVSAVDRCLRPSGMASNQAKVFCGGGCALDKGAVVVKWPSWPSALNPPLLILLVGSFDL